MPRSVLIASTVAALVLVCIPASASSATRLSARLAACATGPTADERYAVFTASMPRSRSGPRLRMRFVLEQRAPGGRVWSRIAAPRFGVWMRAKPGVSGFVYSKRVEALRAPAAYRAVVSFRWLGSDGRVNRSARRTTGVCTQPDPRPDLAITGLHATSAWGVPAVEVLVVNEGRAATVEPTLVTLLLDGVEQPSRDVPRLRAGETTSVTFPATACAAGSVLEARIDPQDRVDEVSETDNRRSSVC